MRRANAESGMRDSMILIALVVAGAILTLTAEAQTIAITGGKVYPVSGPPIENGTVLIRDGKIAAVGATVAIPDGAERIDATGKWVTPGLVNGATQLGLVEIGQVAETRQATFRGRGDAIAAAFTVWDGLNPASVLLAAARNDGVTSALIAPSGGLIAGQAAIIDIVEGSVSDMVLKSPVAMVGQIGDASRANFASRGELMVRMRELLEDTRVYARRRADYDRGDTRTFAASRLDLEAMIPVLQGRLPLVLSVNKASDIDAALKLAKDYDLRIILADAAEAWMVADKIAAAKVPVLTGAMNNIPGSFSTLGQRQENAGILRSKGIEIAIIGNAGGGDEEAFNVRNIKQEAGNAVAYGLAWEEALRAITLAPAEIFGVADRIGSLRPGREANVVVWSGDPLEFSTRVEHVLIRGKRIERDDRQQMLIRRYLELPPDYDRP